VRNWNELIVLQNKKKLSREARADRRISTHPMLVGVKSGKFKYTLRRDRGGVRGRSRKSVDGLGKTDVQICGFWPSCEISFPVLLFLNPNLAFHITPRIYIFRGREAVINNLRRCGPVKIDVT
jgi:hypothetical protein